MNRRKTIVTAVVLLLVILIGGMLAYFTDIETKTNVFTIGNVDIQLNEPEWTEESNGSINQTNANALLMTAGKEVAKSPSVENIGSNPAYVFLKVEIPQANVTIGTSTSTQDIYTMNSLDNTHWKEISSLSGNGTHIYAWVTDPTEAVEADLTMQALPASGSTETAALFTSVTLKNIADESAISDANITVTAYGIQTQDLGVTSPADIYALFATQTN